MALDSFNVKIGDAEHPPVPGLTGYGEAACAVFEGNGEARLAYLALTPPGPGDVVVDIHWSGVSTGTERLLWSGEMPPFPGLAYPLVPGYESVGRIVEAPGKPSWVGQMAFVPGASCFEDAHGLFGATASRLVVPEGKVTLLGGSAAPEHTLLALAATAHHAIERAQVPDLIIGNGVLGRLTARMTEAITGSAPTIWETNPDRRTGTSAIDPGEDTRRDYAAPCDVSGNTAALDAVIAACAPRAQITLAGFYKDRPNFAFPPAFMKEITLHVAAEWRAEDMMAAAALVRSGALDLTGLVTHTASPNALAGAYATAFEDPACLKLLIDWGAEP
ncbi:MAG: chlorophyll synthesis pathway protein BchC [Pseudomonadota bacterium]